MLEIGKIGILGKILKFAVFIFCMEDKKIQRVAIFIDGNNFYHGVKRILRFNERVDYQKLIEVLLEKRSLITSFYYVASLDKEADYKKYEKHQNFLKELEKVPNLKIVLCEFKKIKKEEGGFLYIVKGDDVQLSHDILLGAFDDLYDTAIIVSGDEDFLPLIRTLRERFKKRVENAFFRHSSSYKLRRACNFSFRLNKLIPYFVTKKHDTSSSAIQRQH